MILNAPINTCTSLLKKKSTFFLFGNALAFWENDKWTITDLSGGNVGKLPMMNLQLKLIAHSENKIPFLQPFFTIPKQEDGKIIYGSQKAVQLEIAGKDFWITDRSPARIMIDGKIHQLELSKLKLQLPFEFLLTKFKMDMNPGSEMPSSYESFVKIFSADGNQDHHIYMNHPLKIMGLTFYQSSYFQNQNGEFGSVLSVNIDPGRSIKYWGSLLLVLGAIIHYLIIYRRKTKELASE